MTKSQKKPILQRFVEHERTSGWLHPKLLKDDIVKMRAKIYMLSSMTFCIADPFVAFPYFRDGHYGLGFLTLSFGSLAFASVFVLRFVGSMTLATNLIGLALFGATASGFMVLGGVSSYTVKWLIVLPFLGIFSSKRYLAMLWLTIALVTPVVFFFLFDSGVLTAMQVFSDEEYPLIDLGNSLVFLCALTGFVYVLNMHYHWVVDRLQQNEKILQQRNEDLASARDAAILASQIKDRFLANMSHELRTPLNAILGYSEMIQEELEDEGNQEYNKEFELIQRSGRSLVQMLHDILALTQFEVGEIEVEVAPFILEKELERLVSGFERTIVLEVDPYWNQRHISTHLPSFMGLLDKLIDNACKFTPEDKLIKVVLHPVREGDTHAVLEVIDHGPGIDASHHHIIFEPFSQVDNSSTRAQDGAGLGLSLVKHFAELLELDVEFESVPGEGTTFCIKIPVTLLVS